LNAESQLQRPIPRENRAIKQIAIFPGNQTLQSTFSVQLLDFSDPLRIL